MQVKPAFSQRFYCYPATNQVEGPFELVELAGLLQDKLINGETQTLREGEEAWLPFQDRTEYNLAREVPEEAVASYAREKVETQAASFNPRKLLPLCWMLVPLFLYLLYRVGFHVVHHLLHDSY